jgi:NIPSNAP
MTGPAAGGLFELRQYRMRPGQRENWVRFMEEVIIPFQVSRGMVIVGSFVGEEESDLYVWIRRFENEQHREQLYQEVYESDHWKNEIAPRVPEMVDRERHVITRLSPTPRSVLR